MNKYLNKKTYKVLIIASISIAIMLLTSSYSHATNDSHIELKVVDIQQISGKDQQVILELWAYNIDFKEFDIKLNYDATKVKPSTIDGNDYLSISDMNSTLGAGLFEKEITELSMWGIGEEDGSSSWIKIMVALLQPIANETDYIKLDDGKTNNYHIEAGEEGVLLGSFSYRLFNGRVNEATFSIVSDEEINFKYMPRGFSLS